ncbi:MAG: Invasion associated locus B family protein, partial [Alphaproteobacteria bacterium]
VEVGSDTGAFVTQAEGAWLNSAPDEARRGAAMRASGGLTGRGRSRRGTLTTDTYSLKGISAALDKLAEGCK